VGQTNRSGTIEKRQKPWGGWVAFLGGGGKNAWDSRPRKLETKVRGFSRENRGQGERIERGLENIRKKQEE